MSVRIIYVFELVEVEEHYRKTPRMALRQSQRRVEPVIQQGAVRQPRYEIVEGQVAGLFLLDLGIRQFGLGIRQFSLAFGQFALEFLALPDLLRESLIDERQIVRAFLNLGLHLFTLMQRLLDLLER